MSALDNALYIQRLGITASPSSSTVFSGVGPYVEVHKVSSKAAKLVARILVFEKHDGCVIGISPIFNTGYAVAYGKHHLTLLHPNELGDGTSIVPSTRLKEFPYSVVAVTPLTKENRGVSFAIFTDSTFFSLCNVNVENDVIFVEETFFDIQRISAKCILNTSYEKLSFLFVAGSEIMFWRMGQSERQDLPGIKRAAYNVFLQPADDLLLGLTLITNEAILYRIERNAASASSDGCCPVFTLLCSLRVSERAAIVSAVLVDRIKTVFVSDAEDTISAIRVDTVKGELSMAKQRHNPNVGKLKTMAALSDGLLFSSSMGTFHSISFDSFSDSPSVWYSGIPVRAAAVFRGDAACNGGYLWALYYSMLPGDESPCASLAPIGAARPHCLEPVMYENMTRYERYGYTCAVAYSEDAFAVYYRQCSYDIDCGVVESRMPGDARIRDMVVSPPFIITLTMSNELFIWLEDAQPSKMTSACLESSRLNVNSLIPELSHEIHSYFDVAYPFSCSLTLLDEDNGGEDDFYTVCLGTTMGTVLIVESINVCDGRICVPDDQSGLVFVLAVSCSPLTCLFNNSTVYNDACENIHKMAIALDEDGQEYLIDIDKREAYRGRTYPSLIPDFVPSSIVENRLTDKQYLAGLREETELLVVCRKTLREVFSRTLTESPSRVTCMINTDGDRIYLDCATPMRSAYDEDGSESYVYSSYQGTLPDVNDLTAGFAYVEKVSLMRTVGEQVLLWPQTGMPFLYDFNKGALENPKPIDGINEPFVMADVLPFARDKMLVAAIFEDSCIHILCSTESGSLLSIADDDDEGECELLQSPRGSEFTAIRFSKEMRRRDELPDVLILASATNSTIKVLRVYIDEELNGYIHPMYIIGTSSPTTMIYCSTRFAKNVAIWCVANNNLFRFTPPKVQKTACVIQNESAVTAFLLVDEMPKKDVVVTGHVDGSITCLVDVDTGVRLMMRLHGRRVLALSSHRLCHETGTKALILSLGEERLIIVCILDAELEELRPLTRAAFHVDVPTSLCIVPRVEASSPYRVLVAGDGVEVIEFCRKELSSCVFQKKHDKVKYEEVKKNCKHKKCKHCSCTDTTIIYRGD